MSPQTTAERLLRESFPVAGVLSFWIGLSWIALEPAAGTAIRLIGIVMATAYALRRGVELAEGLPAGRTVVETNLAVALAAGVWVFVTILVSAFLDPLLDTLLGATNVEGFGVLPVDSIQFVTVGTAVAVAGLYATATTVSTLRGRDPPADVDFSGAPDPADD